MKELQNFGKEYYDNIMIPSANLKTSQFQSRAKFLVDKFSPSNVLDIGCGMGYFVKYLRDLNINAYGIDVSEYAISLSPKENRKYLAVSNVEKDELPLPDNTKAWDVITMFDVVEHLHDPETLLRKISPIIKPSGLVFVNTPTKFVNSRAYLMMIGNFRTKPDPTHINVHDRPYWIKAFRNYNFQHMGTFAWEGDCKISHSWTGKILQSIPIGE